MWIREDDRASGVNEHDFEVSIRRDGQEVAWGFDDSYQPMRSFTLVPAASRHESGDFGRDKGNESWGLADVTPGTYQVVVTRDDGRVVSEQTIEGGDGTFVPHTRSALDYQPRSRFLTPVRAGTIRRAGGSPGQHDLFWIAPEE